MDRGMLLEVRNLSVAYGETTAAEDVSFSLGRGEILVIAGESGSGKSTILKAVNGLLGRGAKVSGQILLAGQEVAECSPEKRQKISGERIAMIFQNAGASFCAVRRVGEQIYESVRASGRGWSRREFRERAEEVMEHIHLDFTALDEYPFRLSGGMGQRAGILAAMLLSPTLLLADEPTSALDAMAQVSVAKELMELRHRHGVSILMVTHHMGLAWYMADHILVMRKGRMVEYGTREQIFRASREDYTRELIRAVPRLRWKSA